MPYSDNSNNPAIEDLIRNINPGTVLDVGAGAGKYGRMARRVCPNATAIDCVEVWEPYITEFGLRGIYDLIRVADIRTGDVEIEKYDLVIFGDVLEHMTKEESIEVFSKVTGDAIISIPIVHYPQGHSHGNPFEEHVKDDWSIEEVLETFPVSVVAQSDITAVFHNA